MKKTVEVQCCEVCSATDNLKICEICGKAYCKDHENGPWEDDGSSRYIIIQSYHIGKFHTVCTNHDIDLWKLSKNHYDEIHASEEKFERLFAEAVQKEKIRLQQAFIAETKTVKGI